MSSILVRPNLSNLLPELQISRESALLGSYDTALLYYESVLNTLSQHLKSLASHEREPWSALKSDILKEFGLVKELSMELARFKVPAQKLIWQERPALGAHKSSLWQSEGEGDTSAWSRTSPLPKRIARRGRKYFCACLHQPTAKMQTCPFGRDRLYPQKRLKRSLTNQSQSLDTHEQTCNRVNVCAHISFTFSKPTRSTPTPKPSASSIQYSTHKSSPAPVRKAPGGTPSKKLEVPATKENAKPTAPSDEPTEPSKPVYLFSMD